MREFLTSISYPSLNEDGSILVSPELSLEPIKVDHVKEMWPQVKESQEHLARFLPWAENASKESLTQYFAKCEEDFVANTNRVYAIRVNNHLFKKQVVGCISLKLNFVGKNYPGNAELGYYLFQDATGHNFTHEAVQALCTVTYTHDNVQRFEIKVRVENTASRNVALKLNAKFEGELRNYFGQDYCLYSYVLPDDFIQQNQLINDRLVEGEGLAIAPFSIENLEEVNVEELAEATRQATNNLNQAEAQNMVSRIVAQQNASVTNNEEFEIEAEQSAVDNSEAKTSN
ncbi:GNAT family N-acetyltransferase [Psittacicella gerlachiana]|uniref:N-acetyltransferase domain-containing protein n=1 Tax=Psittacicella gerlachiana TaxID=2028574 RepID=A0A3A1YID8_9GAMM|nr:GNAT family N-acetyltransferase [Psittacicella gerlachiana]RIY37922.1 hypothetical protein CKF59_01160 [Psittacicella gerlachiana]